MLKTAEAVKAMLQEQIGALEAEAEARMKRDEAMIEAIKADGVAFQDPIMAMVHNLGVAIKMIDGTVTPEVTHG